MRHAGAKTLQCSQVWGNTNPAESRRGGFNARQGSKDFKIGACAPGVAVRSSIRPVPLRPGRKPVLQHVTPRPQTVEISFAEAHLAQRCVRVRTEVNR